LKRTEPIKYNFKTKQVLCPHHKLTDLWSNKNQLKPSFYSGISITFIKGYLTKSTAASMFDFKNNNYLKKFIVNSIS